MRAPRPGSILLALATLVALPTIGIGGGCGFGADYGGTGYQCGEGDRCPAGFDCIDGYCRTSGPTPDGSTSDAEDPDAALVDASDVDAGNAWVPSGCGNLSLLQDDFDDGFTGSQWDLFEDVGVNTAEGAGHLEIELAAGTSGVFGGYTSAQLFDLTGGALEATVTLVGGEDTVLEIRGFDGGRAQLTVEGNAIFAAVFDVPGGGTRAEIPYDPEEHRHWRMREDAGTLYWETSPTRAADAWTPFHSETVPFPATDVFGIASAGGQLAVTSTARFDDVNGDAPASLRFCPTDSFTEEFAAAPLTPTWNFWQDGCTMTESGGELVMSFDGVGNNWCGLETLHLFDLRDSEVVFDVSAGDASEFVTYAQIVKPRDDDTHLELNAEQDTISIEQSVDNINVDEVDVPFDRVEMRYWRISESGGEVTFWTSPDGADWSPHLTTPVSFDVSAVQILIGAGHYNDGPGAPVTSEIASVNGP